MPLSEFSLINQFFKTQLKTAFPAELGIGDDCALVDVPKGKQLAISTDTLVEGIHFLHNSDPLLLGHKSLAVNLSDLAAMGAKPAWVSLALTLPTLNEMWLAAFSKGFLSLARQHSVQLIGGDTTQGPLAINATVMGLLPKGKALKRSGAKVGDDIFVTGVIGSAGLGLIKAREGQHDLSDYDVQQYLKPTPNVEIGEQLLTLSSSCIDISDGLAADLTHMLNASGVGAILQHEAIPMTDSVKAYSVELNELLWPYSTGDDYQLCFTLSKGLANNRQVSDWQHKKLITRVGEIVEGEGLCVNMADGSQKMIKKGYEHFSSSTDGNE